MTPEPLPFPAVYTADETAALLKVSREAVMRLLRSGALRGLRVGKEWRITPAALAAFVEQGQPPRPAAQGPARRQSRLAPRPVSEPVTLAARMLGKR